jgi:hypothetical protein
MLETPDVLPTKLVQWVPCVSEVVIEPGAMITPSFADALRDNAAGFGIYDTPGDDPEALYVEPNSIRDMYVPHL